MKIESEDLDDDNLQESNCPPCPSASDTTDFKVSCIVTFVALYSNLRASLW